MKCPKCHRDTNGKFCEYCGTLLSQEEQTQNSYQKQESRNNGNPYPGGAQTGYQQPYPPQDEDMLPPQYKPISMWGYFGYQLLFSIPCVGLILLLVFSFGGTQNVNLKNFARSYFCFLIILAIVFGILTVTGSIAGIIAAVIP